jgi:hypothetical protein
VVVVAWECATVTATMKQQMMIVGASVDLVES